MNAQRIYSLSIAPACVIADGPYETDADGGYDYCVCFGDEEGEPITENKAAVWRCDSYEATLKWAGELARRYGLELICEASSL